MQPTCFTEMLNSSSPILCVDTTHTGVCVLSRSVVSDSCDPMDYSPPGSCLLSPWHFPGKNTGVGCHFFLQEIFLAQGSNLCFLHCRLSLSHIGRLNTSDLGLGDSASIVLSFKLGKSVLSTVPPIPYIMVCLYFCP